MLCSGKSQNELTSKIRRCKGTSLTFFHVWSSQSVIFFFFGQVKLACLAPISKMPQRFPKWSPGPSAHVSRNFSSCFPCYECNLICYFSGSWIGAIIYMGCPRSSSFWDLWLSWQTLLDLGPWSSIPWAVGDVGEHRWLWAVGGGRRGCFGVCMEREYSNALRETSSNTANDFGFVFSLQKHHNPSK